MHCWLTTGRFCLQRLSEMTHPGDVILLMGARDPSLSDFAVEVLEKLPGD